jgi:cytochrome c
MRRAVLLLILLAACNSKQKHHNMPATGGNADRGRKVLQNYGCTSCHAIPGVSGPQGEVGPPLARMGSRQLIGGKFQNTPRNMMNFIRNPQAMDPQNAMPNLGVTAGDARDIAAYLSTLK